MSKPPPIPREQQSHRAPGAEQPDVAGGKSSPARATNLKEQGRAGNLYQNTHNQGHQQDR
jgi:hypothetical protein